MAATPSVILQYYSMLHSQSSADGLDSSIHSNQYVVPRKGLQALRNSLRQSLHTGAEQELEGDCKKNCSEFKREATQSTNSIAVIFFTLDNPLVLVCGWSRLGKEMIILRGFLACKTFVEKTLIIEVSNESLSKVQPVYISSLAIGVFCSGRNTLGKHHGRRSCQLNCHATSLTGYKKIPGNRGVK